jgi:hypothetical protein
MVNQTYVDHKAYGWEGSYTYSSIVGGFLRLLLNSERVLTSISRHNFSPLRSRHKILPNQGGKFMDLRCSPHTLQIFSECFT